MINLPALEGLQPLLLQHLLAGVVVHAPDTRILFANDEAARLMGLSLDQLTGKVAIDPAWSFVREDGTLMPVEAYPVNQILATGQPIRDLVLGCNRPERGDRVWVLVRAYPELSPAGTLQQIVVTFIDITERRRAEALVAAQRDLARILATATDPQVAWPHCLELGLQITEMDCGGIYLFDTYDRVLEM
ncbi:MAG: PAS domain-containing protein, partial [Chloroflexales bacterium]|nr:PAS domain-containing protein [Chloroflexales bacterium]